MGFAVGAKNKSTEMIAIGPFEIKTHQEWAADNNTARPALSIICIGSDKLGLSFQGISDPALKKSRTRNSLKFNLSSGMYCRVK
jgi:hypothetical protein